MKSDRKRVLLELLIEEHFKDDDRFECVSIESDCVVIGDGGISLNIVMDDIYREIAKESDEALDNEEPPQ